MNKRKFPDSPSMTLRSQRTQVIDVESHYTIDLTSDQAIDEFYHQLVETNHLTQEQGETDKEFTKRLNDQYIEAVTKEIKVRIYQHTLTFYKATHAARHLAARVEFHAPEHHQATIHIQGTITIHGGDTTEHELPEYERLKKASER